MNQLVNHSQHKIVILGAGFGGLGMAAQLKKAGFNDFIIIEKGADIGGVWRDNIYPGAACDTQSHLYCYQFFPHLRVSRLYADQPEFINYMNALIEEYQLRDHIILNAEITKATWDQEQHVWQFIINETKEITSQYFIPAWGQLNTPSIPDFKGLNTFKGQYFHSARWDYAVDLKDKKVASIGAAASAVQYIPEIAPVTKDLTIFQRSANWILPRQQVVFTEEELNQFEENPETFMQSRKELFDMRESGFSVLTQGSDAQKLGMQEAKNYLNETIKDPILREKLTPDYEYGCKRILRTSHYYPALQLPHVHLETTPIQEFYEEGIITTDGKKHPADVVIFGTGFKSQAFHGNLQIEGLNNITLSDYWETGASAYLGITVPHFPNMFLIYGPNTNLNHNSILLMIELQLHYIVQAIEELEEKKIPAITINEEIYSDFNKQLQTNLKETAFSTSCSSWYKNKEGKIINNWSGTVAEYKALVNQFNIQDFTQL
ncbi:NAD(P)/FAD-dependent oxidoreductase [Ignatzschineria rhizosphaerae]|uniref:NAD(P)/FAD-dependent oxidoreductase n=1 Tax=Ignatzschineria rhizosphaerae TaxID=2923279 RepID=A0ABY3X214_9GAMM|nr:NAD(P)/FAD-dependent oxidoreductase [Ignatzschineria rhizosphaerae]UNM96911.1 NAD(P)/FAD-dependent oxidoreductase [Ignatzschineria rhizosphaerae]